MAVTMEILARVPESAGGLPERKRGRGRQCKGLYAQRRRKTPLPEASDRVRRWLRRVMRDQEITQTELSLRTGLTQGQICRILTGCSEMRVSTLVRVAEALGLRMVFVPETKIQAAREKKQRGGPDGAEDGTEDGNGQETV